MTPYLNHLIETVQLRGHNIHFYAELTKIIPNYHQIPGRVVQSVGHVSQRSWVVSYWGKYMHEVLVNRLGGLSQHRKSVVSLTHGRKTTTQQPSNLELWTEYFSSGAIYGYAL